VTTSPNTIVTPVSTAVLTAKYRASLPALQPSFPRRDLPRYTMPMPSRNVKPGAHRCVSVRTA